MWEKRDLDRINSEFARSKLSSSNYFGRDGTTARLGRASALRLTSERAYRSQKKVRGNNPVGPYLPVIFEACQEDEFAYEYRHGVISYGAFTYAIVAALRRLRSEGITFNKLLSVTNSILKKLGYAQKANILGPNVLLDSKIPW